MTVWRQNNLICRTVRIVNVRPNSRFLVCVHLMFCVPEASSMRVLSDYRAINLICRYRLQTDQTGTWSGSWTWIDLWQISHCNLTRTTIAWRHASRNVPTSNCRCHHFLSSQVIMRKTFNCLLLFQDCKIMHSFFSITQSAIMIWKWQYSFRGARINRHGWFRITYSTTEWLFDVSQ